jgi:hypothetical protein
MKKSILSKFSHAFLSREATKMILGGANCQVISCASGTTCKTATSTTGKSGECCYRSDGTISGCWWSTKEAPTSTN